jgi:MFS family permease
MGPAIAGIVVAAWGTASAFFINAFSFIAFIIALVSLPARAIGSKEEEAKRASGIKDGFRYVRADRPSLAMVGMIAVMTICIFPTVSVMMPLYVRDVLHLGPDKLGFIMAAAGGGSICGAIILIMIPRHHRASGMATATVAVSCAVFGLSRVHDFPFAFLALMVTSLGLSLIFGLSNTIVQERAPNYLRGRVSAVMGLSFFGLMPLAGLGVTSLADAIGMRTALAASSILYAIGSLGILAWIGSRLNQTPHPNAEIAEVAPEAAPV